MITLEQMDQLAGFIKDRYGIQLKPEKKAILAGRLDQELERLHFGSFTDYLLYVSQDSSGLAATELVNHITTNHTYFLREVEHFYHLRDQVLPVLEHTLPERDLRIWSAGCSSGEEPYTLAMLLSDYFGARSGGWDYRVLATDISQRVLSQAAKGEYGPRQLEGLPARWRKVFFREQNGVWLLNDELKKQVIFRRLNLMDTHFPFKKKMHIIFCRNVMIYFDSETRSRLVEKFTKLLEPGGYLFVGHSESLDRNRTSLSYIQPAVYRKER